MDGDAKRLDNLRLAFNVLQVPPHMCHGIFQTLAAILWLGNLKFQVYTYYCCHVLVVISFSVLGR